MQEFQKKVELLVAGMSKIDGVSCAMPAGTFYVFPSVAASATGLGLRHTGWRCIYWKAPTKRAASPAWAASASAMPGRGFLRLSCAQPDDRIAEAFAFMAEAFKEGSRGWGPEGLHPELLLTGRDEEPHQPGYGWPEGHLGSAPAQLTLNRTRTERPG